SVGNNRMNNNGAHTPADVAGTKPGPRIRLHACRLLGIGFTGDPHALYLLPRLCYAINRNLSFLILHLQAPESQRLGRIISSPLLLFSALHLFYLIFAFLNSLYLMPVL